MRLLPMLLLACACRRSTVDDAGPSDTSILPDTETPPQTPPEDLGREPPILDLADVPDVLRLHGHTPFAANLGAPVAGGLDVDGDGFLDVALSTFRADPLDRKDAGEAYVAFGTGVIGGVYDSVGADPNVLVVWGSAERDTAGSEIWMGDVTGDGIGDLLIARQNHNASGRIGAGAVTVLVGGPALRTQAASLQPVDLASPPSSLVLTTFVGPSDHARLGIWVRVGDVDGDGVVDLVMGADQAGEPTHAGAVFVVRGGPRLATGGVVDLAAADVWEGDVAEIRLGDADGHLGATVQAGDLDGDGRAEVLIGATINRAGASLLPLGSPGDGAVHGSGGLPHGAMFVVWDDAFGEGAWERGPLWLGDGGPDVTRVDGGNRNNHFGEELLAGDDFDGDGQADVFVGDIIGDLSPAAGRPNAGSGHVLWSATQWRGQTVKIDELPSGLETTTFFGAEGGDLLGDTATQGDLDGDGATDLVICAPDSSPGDRDGAGTLIAVFGGQRWPREVDLRHERLPPADAIRLVEVWGAAGRTFSHDAGDMLCYSGASADVDGDGFVDPIVNEMLGNGLAEDTWDVGNTIVLSGATIAAASR